MKAGIPIITLKLNGGIASIATLNKDHTEVQTKIKIITSKIGKIVLKNLISLVI